MKSCVYFCVFFYLSIAVVHAESEQEEPRIEQLKKVVPAQNETQKSIGQENKKHKEERAKEKKERESQNEDLLEGFLFDSNAPKNSKWELDDDFGSTAVERTREEDLLPDADVLIEVERDPEENDCVKAKKTDHCAVHYTAYLLKTGKVFDSTHDRMPFGTVLGYGLPVDGWDVGITGMCVGERRKLTIPAKYGYEEGGFALNGVTIHSNATLVYEMELIDIQTNEQYKMEQEEEKKRYAKQKADRVAKEEKEAKKNEEEIVVDKVPEIPVKGEL